LAQLGAADVEESVVSSILEVDQLLKASRRSRTTGDDLS
jgi:hypothetical protein